MSMKPFLPRLFVPFGLFGLLLWVWILSGFFSSNLENPSRIEEILTPSLSSSMSLAREQGVVSGELQAREEERDLPPRIRTPKKASFLLRVRAKDPGKELPEIHARIFSLNLSPKGEEERVFFRGRLARGKEFKLPFPPKGRVGWALELSSPGYRTEMFPIPDSLDEEGVLEWKLEKGVDLVGRVVGHEGKPVGGAWVDMDLGLDLGDYPLAAFSDPQGVFRYGVSKGKPFSEKVFLEVDRENVGATRVFLQRGDLAGYSVPVLTLGSGETFQFHLLFSNGEPLPPGIKVVASLDVGLENRPPFGRLSAAGETDHGGWVRVLNLARGPSYLLEFELPIKINGVDGEDPVFYQVNKRLKREEMNAVFLFKKVQVDLDLSQVDLERPGEGIVIESKVSSSKIESFSWGPSLIVFPPHSLIHTILPLNVRVRFSWNIPWGSFGFRDFKVNGRGDPQKVFIQIPPPKGWVVCKILVKTPPLPFRKYFLVFLKRENGDWVPLSPKGAGGVYEVLVPPGRQKLMLDLRAEIPSTFKAGARKAVVTRYRWFPTQREQFVSANSPPTIVWKPKPASKLFIQLQPDPAKETNQPFQSVLVDHMDPRDSQGRRVLEQVYVGTVKPLKSISMGQFSPGLHSFRIHAEGYRVESLYVNLLPHTEKRVLVLLRKEAKPRDPRSRDR